MLLGLVILLLIVGAVYYFINKSKSEQFVEKVLLKENIATPGPIREDFVASSSSSSTPTMGSSSSSPTPTMGSSSSSPTLTMGSSSSSPTPTMGSSSSGATPTMGSSSSSSMLVMGSSSSSGSYNPVVDRPATVSELQEFQTRIQAEIDRLSASGALDAITQQRIRSLQKIKDYIQQILNEVSLKQLPENRIPIMKSSVDAAFKALSSNTQLPDVFNDSQIDTYLKGILPDNMANDPEIARTIADYMRSFTQNLSWNFGVKYVSNAERDLANSYNQRANQESEDITDSNLAMASSAAGHLPNNYSNTNKTSDEFANTPQEACRGPATFDWKKRSNEICRALKSRGLETKDYGCMPEDVEVGPAFSFKGYARMICTRVAANYDTGLGSLVGCPPLDWPGWRLK